MVITLIFLAGYSYHDHYDTIDGAGNKIIIEGEGNKTTIDGGGKKPTIEYEGN